MDQRGEELDRWCGFERARLVALGNDADIGGGARAGWGKGCFGPIWRDDLGGLEFSDAGHSRRLLWQRQNNSFSLQRSGTNSAMGAAFDTDGQLLLCEWRSGRLIRLEPEGNVSVLAEGFQGQRFNRVCHVVAACDGTIFFADLRQRWPEPNADALPFSGLYRLAPDRSRIDLVTRASPSQEDWRCR